MRRGNLIIVVCLTLLLASNGLWMLPPVRADEALPTVAAAVVSGDGKIITLSCDMAMADPGGKQAQFTVSVDG
ncbi:MAG TPA: hypothetical protein VN426_05470, partial [Syntrophomonadaceae bacterium]|nr:hypothetical protein [Syntrophomonadaceae bacterium]